MLAQYYFHLPSAGDLGGKMLTRWLEGTAVVVRWGDQKSYKSSSSSPPPLPVPSASLAKGSISNAF